MSVGVSISTTGTRPEFLERAEAAWRDVLAPDAILNTVYDLERRGVAHAKNAGLRNLMAAGVEHLFLADDDVYPLSRESWEAYTRQPVPHLSVCWGKHRFQFRDVGRFTVWKWPRGVVLYFHRSAIDAVGGYRTDYGVAHEHADLSRRIHQAGLTPHMFMDLDREARDFWHAEDMPLPGERPMQVSSRRRRITTIKRTTRDTQRIVRLWQQYDGDTSYVPYEETP